MILDVGCGNNPHGDVNIDIRKLRHKNFIRAEGSYLPFKASVFNIVYCFHVLEHSLEPTRIIEECKRVVNGSIIFKVPNNPIWDLNDRSHLYSWNRYTFEHFLMKHGFRRVQVLSGHRLPMLDIRILRQKTMLKKWLDTLFFVIMRKLLKEENEIVGICEP